MPPWLIKSFEATLEEIYTSDVLLLLLDGSDSLAEFKRKLNVSIEILESRLQGKLIPVINKIDAAEEIDEKVQLLSDFGEAVLISAKRKIGLDKLVNRIYEEAGISEYRIVVDSMQNEAVSYIRRFGKIEGIEEGEKIKIKFTMQKKFYEELKKKENSP